MKLLTAFFAGLLFGVGLIVSGLSLPSTVLGVLDLAGRWDPSLAFVMGGALLVGIPAFLFAARRRKSMLGEVMQLPTSTTIDRRLLLGSLTFGAGWGLAGFCPGPALASLAQGGAKPLIFFAAMLAGMALFGMLERRVPRIN